MWMVIRLWFIEHTWSPHFPCFSKPSTSGRIARPQTSAKQWLWGTQVELPSPWMSSLALCRPTDLLGDAYSCLIKSSTNMYKVASEWMALEWVQTSTVAQGWEGVSAEIPGKAHLMMRRSGPSSEGGKERCKWPQKVSSRISRVCNLRAR